MLERYHTNFVRAGANLSEAQKKELRALNEQVSSKTTEFRQLVLKGDNAAAIVVDKKAELDGLSDAQIATAAEAAKTRGKEGKYVLTLLNTTGQPPLAELKNRAVRERLYKASIDRGWSGEFDTTKLIAEIVKLRADRAKLLGYPNHAAYVLEDETALTAEAVNSMLHQLAPAAVANAKREAADMQQLIDAQAKANGTPSFQLQAWDWDFYAEQVRAKRYSYDEAQVRPYFELNRVLVDGVLFAAQELYGLKFKERKDLPVYQEDVRVFDVIDRDGSPLGLFLFDPYARSNKRGGAWMNSFVEQSRLLGNKPVVTNTLNIPKPPAGQPTLLTWDEVTTTFHEFGHAHPRLVLERAVPAVLRHQRAARLRRVPVAVQRDVGHRAARAGELREASSDRRAHAEGADGQSAGGAEVQPGLCDHRISGRRHPRSELSPAGAGQDAGGGRYCRFRGECIEVGARGLRTGAAALSVDLLPAHLLQPDRLLRRLLRLHLERSAGAGHRALVQDPRRLEAGERRPAALEGVIQGL